MRLGCPGLVSNVDRLPRLEQAAPPLAPRQIGAFLAAMAETLIVPIPTPEWARIVDSRRPPPEVYRWLATQPDRDPVVELPMLGQKESLNVATAAGIALYHLRFST